MGALGSALVEIHPASLAGHYALTRFYQHVDASQAANRHEQFFQLLTESNSGLRRWQRRTPLSGTQ